MGSLVGSEYDSSFDASLPPIVASHRHGLRLVSHYEVDPVAAAQYYVETIVLVAIVITMVLMTFRFMLQLFGRSIKDFDRYLPLSVLWIVAAFGVATAVVYFHATAVWQWLNFGWMAFIGSWAAFLLKLMAPAACGMLWSRYQTKSQAKLQAERLERMEARLQTKITQVDESLSSVMDDNGWGGRPLGVNPRLDHAESLICAITREAARPGGPVMNPAPYHCRHTCRSNPNCRHPCCRRSYQAAFAVGAGAGQAHAPAIPIVNGEEPFNPQSEEFLATLAWVQRRQAEIDAEERLPPAQHAQA